MAPGTSRAICCPHPVRQEGAYVARSRKARRLTLTATLAAAGLLITGCSTEEALRFGWPEGITPQAERMRQFWTGSVIAALIVGILVWALMFWAFIVYRKKKSDPLYPKQTKENLPLELIYTVVPFLMVGVLFFFTVSTENFALAKDDEPDVVVDVTAFKWNWDFGYQGTEVPGGGEVHTVGSTEEIPILVLPTNQVIQYELESKDVIHSFWVIDFNFKRDVFPDPEANQSDNVFQNTIEREGAFVGRCAELCGTYHSMMNFELRAVPGDVYDAYIDLRESENPATGAPYSAAEALRQLQQDFPDCGELCSPEATTTYPFNPDRNTKTASEAEQPLAGGN
ncbi:cytochrome c oxidase subunit II [Nakamurella sp. YIM 132084]|uniref:Cytochrome c oxidase subunit 2 n=1 Tax=Nakamurella leprariae TaxID=2803911 RepID=A0A939BVW5_9ACTN|nr:cytochrome c oxidase subunit II [Nakamurella leprariae]